MTYAIDLEGRRALITGSGQRVGLAIARAMADAGATVLVNDVLPERADAAVAEIEGRGGKAEPAVFDVTDGGAVHAAVTALGDVDILVNNAGHAGVLGWTFTPFQESTEDEWARYFDVNLYGVMHCTHAVLPSMIARGWGRIITIISDAARSGEPYIAPYAAAKAGAAAFARSIAREGGRHGITANNISLGTISMEQSDPDTEQSKKMLRPYIIRRFGTPDDVAPMVTLLASDQASWITGQTIPINGGYTVNQ